jgi:hypothetical protein
MKNRKPACKCCGKVDMVLLNEMYDAYYCEKCNAWLEEACDDPNCMFCKNRPEKPIQENEADKE